LYAASWDEAGRVPFWDDLDAVGVNAYFPVATRADASRIDLLAGWQGWLARLHTLSRQAGRNILVTEVGYRSVDGAGRHPYRFETVGQVDLAEQADLAWAALEALGDPDWIDGLLWWNWLASGGGGPSDPDYTPRGKPAEEEFTRAWGQR
jgi:hypothetical protein